MGRLHPYQHPQRQPADPVRDRSTFPNRPLGQPVRSRRRIAACPRRGRSEPLGRRGWDPGLGDSAAPGIGFAIPASTVNAIAGQLIQDGRVTESGRAALGITARTVLDENYEPTGVAVVDVAAGGAADRAGLRPGDIITKVGDTETRTITALAEVLASHRPGETGQVVYIRGENAATVRVTPGEA